MKEPGKNDTGSMQPVKSIPYQPHRARQIMLNEDEQCFKSAYLHGDRQYWEKPVSYKEYLKLCKEGVLAVTPNSSLYGSKTMEGKGITIDEVKTISGNHEQEISANMHFRYSYPVLHNHAYLEIIYVLEGSCIHFLGQTQFEMKRGDLCILAPNTTHAISATADEDMIINIMASRSMFDQNFMSLLSGGKILSDFVQGILYDDSASPYLLYETGGDVWISLLAERILNEILSRRYGYERSILYLTSEIFLQLIREYSYAVIVPNPVTSRPNNHIAGILAYIAMNHQNTSLKDVSDHFGYSEAYMSRLIRQYAGMNFSTLLAKFQMEHAASLLTDTQLSLTEISQQTGCFDASHFTRKFRQIYHMSPSQYRKGLNVSHVAQPVPEGTANLSHISQPVLEGTANGGDRESSKRMMRKG